MISTGTINTWGNGLALRLTKPQAKTAGLTEGTKVRLLIEPGRIVLETEARPTLDQMLADFDAAKHGGEAMSGGSVGVEAFA